MMNLSKTVGYAVHALSCIEQAQGQPLFVQEIADRTGIHKPYLARIINRLVHHGLVASKRGYKGGVVLACPAGQIPLLRIVEALEAETWSRECFFGLEKCPATRVCPAHTMWSEMRADIQSALRGTTLADITRSIRPEADGARQAPRAPTARLAPLQIVPEVETQDSWAHPAERRAAALLPEFLPGPPPARPGQPATAPQMLAPEPRLIFD
jgi:Rrf2 family protein